MFVIARAWRSYPGCPGIAQFPDVFRVARYSNRRPSTRTTRALKFSPRRATAGEASMYPDSKSRSQQLYDRALASLPGGHTRTTGFMKPYPLYAACGEWGRNASVSVSYAKGTPEHVLSDVVAIPFNDAEAAVSLIREHGPELACVLVDPMPNRAGLAPADKTYLEALRQITREVGALLIFDEVITFRLGYLGAQGLWNIDPDLTTLGKIIGGGFPVGGISGHKQFMAGFCSPSRKPALLPLGTLFSTP